jgi:hypothetical protein
VRQGHISLISLPLGLTSPALLRLYHLKSYSHSEYIGAVYISAFLLPEDLVGSFRLAAFLWYKADHSHEAALLLRGRIG